jgi:hypothetical protein
MSDSWRDRAVTWPIGRFFLTLAVFAAVIGVPVLWSIDPHLHPWWPIVGGVLFGLWFSAAMSLWLHVARRRETAAVGDLSPAALIDVNRALRTGDAPRDPALDRAALALVRRRRAQIRRSLKAAPWFCGVMLLLAAVSLVLKPGVDPAITLMAWAVLLVVVLPVATRRQRSRLDRAEHVIRARTGDGD